MYNSVQLDASFDFFVVGPLIPNFFQDCGQHSGIDCSTLMMIASSVVSTSMVIASPANALEKKVSDSDLALDDFHVLALAFFVGR